MHLLQTFSPSLYLSLTFLMVPFNHILKFLIESNLGFFLTASAFCVLKKMFAHLPKL